MAQEKGREAAEVMAKAEPARSHAESGAMGGRGHKADADTHRLSYGSESSDYIAARIKRDHPDIAAAVMRGASKYR